MITILLLRFNLALSSLASVINIALAFSMKSALACMVRV
nr:MAG TPA: hypothetical protein [Caudoviricetes sp.]